MRRLVIPALAAALVAGCATAGPVSAQRPLGDTPGAAEGARAALRQAQDGAAAPADAFRPIRRPPPLAEQVAAMEPPVEALLAAAAPRPDRAIYRRLRLSHFGAVPDDERDDSGAVDQWLDECERRDVECWVDRPGRYRTPNLRLRNMRGDVQVVFVDGAWFDGENALPLAVWSVESNQEWRNCEFRNWGMVWVGSPRPRIDDGDGSSRSNAFGGLRTALRHGLDYFRVIGCRFHNVVAIANFVSGGKTYGRNADGVRQTDMSPAIEDNPLIREVVIRDNVAQRVGGGFNLRMSRWGNVEAGKRGEYPWRFTGNLIEDVRPDLFEACGEKDGYCGQAFQVGIGHSGWKLENGGLLFEGNTVRRLFDWRHSQYTENQGLRIDGGGYVLIRDNVFDSISGLDPTRGELNQEGIYLKTHHTIIEDNTFINVQYFDNAEGGAITMKGDRGAPPPPDCRECEAFVQWAVTSGNLGIGNIVRNNLFVWDDPQTPNPDDPQPTGPRTVVTSVVPDAKVVNNVFRGFDGYQHICGEGSWGKCEARRLIQLRKYGGQSASGNVAVPGTGATGETQQGSAE